MRGWKRWGIVAAIAVLGTVTAALFELTLWSASFSDALTIAPPVPEGMTLVSPTQTYSYLITAVVGTILGTVLAIGVGLVLLRVFRGAVVPAFVAVAFGPIAVWCTDLATSAYWATFDPPAVHVGDILGMSPWELLLVSFVFLGPVLVALIVLVITAKRGNWQSDEQLTEVAVPPASPA